MTAIPLDSRMQAALAQADDLPWTGTPEVDFGVVPPELQDEAAQLQDAVRRGEIKPAIAAARFARLMDDRRTDELGIRYMEFDKAARAAIAAAHHELYATDAAYRAETNTITAAGDTRMQASNQRQQQADDIATRYGITTPHDEAATAARAQYEEARASGDAIATRAAEIELHQRREQQDRERERQLRQRGHHAAADTMGEIAAAEHDDLATAMDAYDRQTAALRQAKKRQLEKGGMTPEEQAELVRLEEGLQKERERLLRVDDVERVRKETRNVQFDTAPLQAPAARFEIAAASLADEKTPLAVPGGVRVAGGAIRD